MVKTQIVAGHNIYQDKDGRFIIYDRFSKAGYVIKPEHYNKFKYFYNRYLIALLLAIILVTFELNIFVCAGVFLLVAVISEFKYRQFLDHLTKIEKFKPENSQKKSKIDALVEENKPGRCILLAVLYLLLSVLIVVNGIILKQSMLLLGIEVIISIVGIYLASINIIAFIRIKKQK